MIFPLKHLIRIGLDAYFHELIGNQVIRVDIRNIFFRNIGRHPDLGQIRNLEQTCRRFNYLAFREVPRDHPPVEWRDDRHIRSDLLIPIQTRNQIILHPQEAKTVLGFAFIRPGADHISFPALRFRHPDDLFLQERLRPLVGTLGHIQLGLRFQIHRLRHAQFTAVQDTPAGPRLSPVSPGPHRHR